MDWAVNGLGSFPEKCRNKSQQINERRKGNTLENFKVGFTFNNILFASFS